MQKSDIKALQQQGLGIREMVTFRDTTIEYKVQGTGTFPFDMLRYDSCRPAYEAEIHMFVKLSERTITVRGLRCTVERWKSFGWKVI